MNNIEFNS